VFVGVALVERDVDRDEGWWVVTFLCCDDAFLQMAESDHVRNVRVTPKNRFLVVDDDKNVRLVLRAYLERKDANVVVDEAASAEDALTLVKGVGLDGFDVVWTDFKMEGMNGLELAHVLREMGFNRYIVLLSGNPPKDVEVALKEAVVDVFLRKPIRKKTMFELPVMQVLD
jgi:CheY-like chemotaxis protein